MGLFTLLLVLLLAACGPEEESASAGTLQEQTVALAQNYAAGGDLETARAALQALETANPSQWLIYVTETAIADPASNPEVTRALVKLSLELGIREATIRSWAQANGLLETNADATAAAQAATVAAAVQSPVQVAPLAPSAPGTTTAPIAAAAPLTAGVPVTAAVPVTVVDAPAQPTAAPAAGAQVGVSQLANLREGPGTAYNLAGALAPGQSAEIIGKNAAGDWWQIRLTTGGVGWLYGPLATTTGSVDAIAVAADIPTPPPAQPTATPAPAEPAQPTAEPTAVPPNPNDQPAFRLVQRRMWTKEENGGCAGQHLLRITVIDANGAPLNGIALKGIYTGAVLVTGDQGKGDGRIEYDLYGTGEGFMVERNNDGRPATSDRAEGFTTKSLDIDFPTLIGGGYCTNDVDCQVFYNSYGCTGHHSWEATLQRNY